MTNHPNISMCEAPNVNIQKCDFSLLGSLATQLALNSLREQKSLSYSLENHKCVINLHSVLKWCIIILILLFKESMEACENLVPLSRVVYNTLTQLEKTFSLSFLKILFSQINLNEYPNLITTLNSFTRGMRLLFLKLYLFIIIWLYWVFIALSRLSLVSVSRA